MPIALHIDFESSHARNLPQNALPPPTTDVLAWVAFAVQITLGHALQLAISGSKCTRSFVINSEVNLLCGLDHRAN
jgi:hypothetical protein